MYPGITSIEVAAEGQVQVITTAVAVFRGRTLDGEFDTYVFGGNAAASYQGAILSLAFSTTGSGSDIRSPYGSYPGYISLMLRDFNRADEDAWLVGLSYNLKFLGLDGLS